MIESCARCIFYMIFARTYCLSLSEIGILFDIISLWFLLFSSQFFITNLLNSTAAASLMLSEIVVFAEISSSTEQYPFLRLDSLMNFSAGTRIDASGLRVPCILMVS